MVELVEKNVLLTSTHVHTHGAAYPPLPLFPSYTSRTRAIRCVITLTLHRRLAYDSNMCAIEYRLNESRKECEM